MSARWALGALVEFRVLGPVEVRAGGRQIDIGHARQRSVLAVLVLEVGQVVTAERLIDRVWGQDAPASVRNLMYGYVARLRAALAAAGEPRVTLCRRPGGYLLEARPEQVDLCRFRRQVTQAGTAAGDDQRAAALRGALSLWRGTALAGLDSPWLAAMRKTLEQQKMAAVLDLNDIALRQGEHTALISDLTGQAAGHPADERLAGQLMLALYRSGRPAEALRWFEQTRQQLAAELGADPGSALRVLHQQILRADPSLAPPPAAGGRGWPAPRELPADGGVFTGRAAELAELDRLLTAPADGTGRRTAASMILVVAGTAGVGKTALAVRWAHRAAASFPDGQLHVNLRGYDPGQPMPAADALAGFLRALGVPWQDIPAETPERAARYRSLLAGRRMLIVLDNAGQEEQVRPLLPGTPGCAVVATSRDSLAGLVARDGAVRLDLGLLPLHEAVGLLRALIGGRVDADTGAAATLAAQCARLPLALRVAAELAAARAGIPLAGLASELAGQRRLDLLDAGGDPRTAVRAVFSWSQQHLDADAAHGFALLGLHPGPDFGPYAAAALTGASVQEASRMLDQLARAHLIQPGRPGRYGMHDLLRAYAAEQAAARDDKQSQQAGLTRLLDHYLHTAAMAMDTLYPAERHRRPAISPPAAPIPPVTEPVAARAWLDAQRAVLTAVAAYAADCGWPRHAIGLAVTMFRYLDTGGHYPEAVTIHTCACRAARHIGDGAAEATALINLGAADLQQRRDRQADGRFQHALALHRQSGDRTGEARALNSLGVVGLRQGCYQQATSHFQHALALHRQSGDRTGEARALTNIGNADFQQGRYQHAADHLQQGLALFRETGDRAGEAQALANLGIINVRQGRDEQAARHLQQAQSLCRETGYPAGEAHALTNLGTVHRRRGRYQQASELHQQALALFREIGERTGEAAALNGLGEVFLGTGQPGYARAQHAAALALASQIGDRYEQACAHNGLGHACHAAGDLGHARHHWQQALGFYASLGAPEADQIRAHLATCGA